MHRIGRFRPYRVGRFSPRVVFVTLAGVLVTIVSAAPQAHATTDVPATTTAPFAGADARAYCDYGASCPRLEVTAARTGALLVGLSAQGTTTLEGGGCGQIGFPVVCPPPYVVMTGAHGRAWVTATQTLPTAARRVAFTVTVRTGQAKASGQRASGTLSASASPAQDSCADCSGGASEQLVDSVTQPSASAATRTLSFVYRSAAGNNVPSGPINVIVELSGEAVGVGSSSVELPATVVSIASAVQG